MISQFMADFHFLRPLLLLLMFLPIWLYWKYYRRFQTRTSWQEVCDTELLNFLLVKGSSNGRNRLSLLAFIGIMLGIFAAAGPTWNKREIPALNPENPVMMLLNLSSDMNEKDLTPSRLERAKFKIRDLLQVLNSVQIGLSVYTSEPFLVSPLTEDTALIENLLPEITYDIMPVNGSRLDKAINYAVEKLSDSGYAKGHILVFTPDGGSEFQQALEAAETAKRKGYEIDVEITAASSSDAVKLLAEKGGGRAMVLSAGDEDIETWDNILNTQKGTLKETKNFQTIWQDSGYYFVFVCLFCALWFFRRGLLLGILLWSTMILPAQAGFFRNANQEGLHQFEQGNFAQAADVFRNGKWKGASLYRAGDYERAGQVFSAEKDVTSLYNYGNALAKGGKIEEAIKKYEEVLTQDAAHEDARFNLEYLKRQKEQKQQQNQGGNGEDNEESSASHNQPASANSGNNSPQQNQGAEQTSPQNNQDEEEAKAQQNEGQIQPGEEKNESSAAQNQKLPQQPEKENTMEEDEDNSKQTDSSKPEKDAPESDEKSRARAQQYRNIPEDTGGLLRAFIRKEYQARKKRR